MRETHRSVGEWIWNSEILWKKIVQTDEDSCWSWIGSTGPQTNLFGARKSGKPQMTQARRILYRDVYEEDCEDKQITMKCKNAYCMNWHHFETQPNQRHYYKDGVARGQREVIDQKKEIPRAKLKKVLADWEQGE
jgi:hypothetical protein|tara:strand:- start:912 stop:1316 length:405 start_codon:yes stop_codon:yes gene_type:complete